MPPTTGLWPVIALDGAIKVTHRLKTIAAST